MFLLLTACASTDKANDSEPAEQVETEAPTTLDPPVNGTNTFVHDDLERKFRLHIPSDAQPDAPLVVVIHGYTSSAQIIEGYSGMNALSEEHGFVVVYPQGTTDDWGNNFFNVGYDFHDSIPVDDIGYIHALIDYLQESLQLSATNVFSMGMSNGGDMSYMLACQSDVVKAIAPVAGCMMKHIYETCEPNRSVPVLEIHGTLDDVTLVEGDVDNSEGWGAYMPLNDTIQFWVSHNNLDASETTDIDDIDSSDGSTVRYHRYYSSSNATEVWLYEVIDGGHDWPGAFGNQDIDSSRLAWDFFSKYID